MNTLASKGMVDCLIPQKDKLFITVTAIEIYPAGFICVTARLLFQGTTSTDSGENAERRFGDLQSFPVGDSPSSTTRIRDTSDSSVRCHKVRPITKASLLKKWRRGSIT